MKISHVLLQLFHKHTFNHQTKYYSILYMITSGPGGVQEHLLESLDTDNSGLVDRAELVDRFCKQIM